MSGYQHISVSVVKSKRQDADRFTACVDDEGGPALVAEGDSRQVAMSRLLEMIEAVAKRRGWDHVVVTSEQIGQFVLRRVSETGSVEFEIGNVDSETEAPEAAFLSYP